MDVLALLLEGLITEAQQKGLFDPCREETEAREGMNHSLTKRWYGMEVDLLRRALERIPSRYELAVVAAERCKQLMNGARPLVDPRGEHPRSIAIREIAEGKLIRKGNQYLPAEDPEMPPEEVRPVQEELTE